MTITINDQAKVSGKLIRRIKYLLYKLKEKFSQILFTRVHLNIEGRSPKEFQVKVVIGLPGQELVYGTKSLVAEEAVHTTYLSLKRLLSRNISKKRDL